MLELFGENVIHIQFCNEQRYWILWNISFKYQKYIGSKTLIILTIDPIPKRIPALF